MSWVVDAVHAATDTDAARYGVTVGLVVAVVLATIGIERVGPWLKDRLRTPLVEVGQALVVAGLWVLAVATLVLAWRASDPVVAALNVLHVSRTQIVLAIVTVALVFAAYSLTRLTKRWVRRLTADRTAISSHEREIAHHVLQLTVYAATALVILSLWEIPVGNLLLGAGFLGIVLGLAARQTLGAMLAGFVVLFSRPFEIGDWVEVGDNEGIVTEITVVNTRLQTFDGEYVMLPNDLVTSEEVVNRSRKGRLRVEVEVGVDYEADLDAAVEAATAAMGEPEDVLSVPQPRVVAKRFGDSAVVLGLRFWIDKPSARRLWRARTAVIREVKAAFADAGVKIPFPQRELSGRAETGGFRVADAEAPSAVIERNLGPDEQGGDDTRNDGDETTAGHQTADGDGDGADDGSESGRDDGSESGRDD
ncbi:MAG: mechanosensitive ion channel family protein, partial [Halobacteriaceae archaeon]